MRAIAPAGFSDIPTLCHWQHDGVCRTRQNNLPRFPPIHSSHHHNKLYNFLNQIQNLVAYESLYPLISTAPISALRFILPAKTGKVPQRYNCIRKANDRNRTRYGT